MIALAPDNHTSNQATESKGLFDIISPTRLNTWIACPLKFKIRYVDGIKEPTSLNLFLGRQVHRGMEFYYRHRLDGVSMQPVDVRQHIIEAWHQAVTEEQVVFSSHDEEVGCSRKHSGWLMLTLSNCHEMNRNRWQLKHHFDVR